MHETKYLATNYLDMAVDNISNLLPLPADKDEYSRIYPNNAVWLPAIRVICRRHHIPTSGLKRTVLGTHIVFQAEDRIIKLFSRFWPEGYPTEIACLAGLHGLRIPEIVATGDLEGWPYLIMSLVNGKPTREVWRFLNLSQKISVMHQLGEFIRQLHEHSHIPGLPSDWDTFLRGRIECLAEHHMLSGDWLRWAYEMVNPLADRPKRLAVLNCDLTDDHILLVNTADNWRLSGVIDFGDAMIGHPYYEFTAPLLDHAFGQPALAAALLEAYGEPLTNDLMNELSRYLLAHRYWRIADMPGDPLTKTPDEFISALWG